MTNRINMKKIKVIMAEDKQDTEAEKYIFFDEGHAEFFCKENPEYRYSEAAMLLPEKIDEVATDNLGITTLLLFAKYQIDLSAGEIAISVKHSYQGKEYYSRMAVQTYETNEKRVLEEMAEDMAEKIYSSNVLCSDVHFKQMLKDAVLAGYNLHQDDMED